MDYINHPVAGLRSHEFADSSLEHVGAWIFLIAYCSERENDGIIKDCSEWSNAAWMRAVGVEKSILMQGSKLWHFGKHGQLVVHDYNSKYQEYRRKQRATNKKNVEKRWAKARENDSKKVVKMQPEKYDRNTTV